MNGFVLQLSFLIDFPPLVGTALIGTGMTILSLWYVQTQLVPAVADGRLASQQQRARIVAPIVLGILLIALGTAVRARVVSIVVVVLFAIGRAIEGSVAVRSVRRIAYYLNRVFVAVSPRTTRAEETSTGLGGYLWSRIVYQVVTVVMVAASITFTAFGMLAIRPTAGYGLSLVWASVVSTTSVFVFVWDLRATLDHVGAVPVVGVLFCILGAEVYNFSPDILQGAVYRPVRRLLPEAMPIIPLVHEGVFHYVLYLFGWVAYGYGIAIAIYLLVTK